MLSAVFALFHSIFFAFAPPSRFSGSFEAFEGLETDFKAASSLKVPSSLLESFESFGRRASPLFSSRQERDNVNRSCIFAPTVTAEIMWAH